MDSNSVKPPAASRSDSRQNTIEKGGKHHVSWLDEVRNGSPLVEYKEVKAYKNNSGGCGCVVS
jgi:hypothetical protein